MVPRGALQASVIVLLALALTVFAGETIHELHYADVHPDAYGPAKVIALACGAGAVLALAAGIALFTTMSTRDVPRWLLLSSIIVAVALGVWLVTLSAQSPASVSGGGAGGGGAGGGGAGGGGANSTGY